MDDAPSAQNASDFRFELFDTCVLKEIPSLICIIMRTYHDFNSHEPVADCLIILHVPVPAEVMKSFLLSGAPPKGYVFVRFAKQEFGHSLVAERDIHLVSRTFAIGDTVKRKATDTMIGTVVSIYDSYVLEPICSVPFKNPYQQHQPPKPFEFHTGFRNCDETCISRLPDYIYHPLRHALLYDVPGNELKRADDYGPGDYVLELGHLGVIQDYDIDAVLLLDNGSVVMVENAWELELVVPNFDGHLVTLPELDDLRRPDVLAYHVGGKAFIPTEHLSRGQFVITNHRNLRNGRWLVGEHDPTCSPQGHVLDVRTRRACINWLCPNIYDPSTPGDRAPSSLRPYDNLSSYSDPRDLRRTKGLTLLDRGQRPPLSLLSKDSVSVNTGQDLEAGDHARFRDQSGAFVKYQGTGHGRYNRVAKDATFGFDMNEFIVFFSKQRVTVRWQDGSTTDLPSLLLKPYVMPEQELCPGDIITLKEGSTQVIVGESEANATEFNEMIYFQGDYILRPQKVGVIQSVNARERLVQVRWFLQPSIRLLQQGNVLQRGAHFGPISDAMEDVSLYEIMAHPAFMRKRRDLVILATRNTSLHTLTALAQHASHFEEERFGVSLLSWVRPPSGIDLNSYLREVAKPIARRDLEDSSTSLPAWCETTNDWVGEILDLGLDGLLTIRLCALHFSQEIRVPWDRVLTIMDEEGSFGFPTGDPTSFLGNELADDHYLTDDSAISATEETIEYEGGKRIDTESGDEGWSTDVDDDNTDEKRMQPGINDPMDVDPSITPITSKANTQEHAKRQEIVQSHETVEESQQNIKWLAGVPAEETAKERPENVPLRTISHQELMSLLNPEQLVSTKTPAAPPIPQLGSPSNTSSLISLAASQTSPPTSFLVLDIPPPPDQFLGINPSSPSSSSNTTPPAPSPTFLKRLHREHRLLSTSLPPSQIYLRTYDSRLDLLRALILGPPDTPYESAPFLIDLYLPPTYPSVPPIAHFHSWTSGLGRINPNFYEEGRICLSLLGTWPGRGSQGESDTWSEKSNLLQLLLSLMGLVLVKRPFYNEAGFEEYEAEGAYKVESLLYSEKAYVMARGFVRFALLKGVVGLEDVLAWVYLDGKAGEEMDGDGGGKGKVVANSQAAAAVSEPGERPRLLRKLIQRARALMQYSSTCTADQRDGLVDAAGKQNPEAFLRPLSQGAVVMLRRHLDLLEQAFLIPE